MKTNVSNKTIEITPKFGSGNNDKSVVLCHGSPRASGNESSQSLTSVNNLYSRELSESLMIQNTYSSKMLAMQKSFACQLIGTTLVLINKESIKYAWEYSEDDNLEDLVAKTIELYLYGIQEGSNHCVSLEKSVYQQLFNAQKDVAGKEIVQNTLLAFSTFQFLLMGYGLCGGPREAIRTLKLDFDPEAPIIEGMNQAIDDAIITLRKIKEEKYFSVFRILLDCNQSLELKYQNLQNYFGLEKLKKEDSSYRRFGTAYNNLSKCVAYIMNLATQLAELQLLMVLFAFVKKGQKTKENLELLIVNIDIHLKHLGEVKKEYQKKKDSGIKHINDYYDIKSHLYQLKCNLEKLKNREVPVILDDLEMHQEKRRSVEITKEEFCVKEIEWKEDQIEELDIDEIERETSILLEVFLQMTESDRRAKLELKEVKAMQKKQLEKAEHNIDIIEKKSIIIKLSSGHQLTLDAIFGDEDCHLKLLGSDIENLITALGGNKKPGKKNKINIFWGNLAKKAGSYEITHGGDCDGVLTRDYVTRVKRAILVGVQLGYISEETIQNGLVEI